MNSNETNMIFPDDSLIIPCIYFKQNLSKLQLKYFIRMQQANSAGKGGHLQTIKSWWIHVNIKPIRQVTISHEIYLHNI